MGFQKIGHKFLGVRVSKFYLVFTWFPWLLRLRNLEKLFSLNTDVYLAKIRAHYPCLWADIDSDTEFEI